MSNGRSVFLSYCIISSGVGLRVFVCPFSLSLKTRAADGSRFGRGCARSRIFSLVFSSAVSSSMVAEQRLLRVGVGLGALPFYDRSTAVVSSSDRRTKKASPRL